jgi:hypothetical protein
MLHCILKNSLFLWRSFTWKLFEKRCIHLELIFLVKSYSPSLMVVMFVNILSPWKLTSFNMTLVLFDFFY